MTFQTHKILPNRSKDVLPLLATINVFYKVVSSCENSYIGRTTHRLGIRIRQHIPKYVIDLFYSKVLPIYKHVVMCTLRKTLASPSSAILKHLLENETCAQMYASDYFTVIGRVETTSKLCVKEALLIHRHKTTLNIQKEAYGTKLFTELGRGYKVKLSRCFEKPCGDAGEFDWSC